MDTEEMKIPSKYPRCSICGILVSTAKTIQCSTKNCLFLAEPVKMNQPLVVDASMLPTTAKSVRDHIKANQSRIVDNLIYNVLRPRLDMPDEDRDNEKLLYKRVNEYLSDKRFTSKPNPDGSVYYYLDDILILTVNALVIDTSYGMMDHFTKIKTEFSYEEAPLKK